MTAKVTIVDEDDNVIGAVTREEAKEANYNRRLVCIMVRNSNEKILLSRVAETKSFCPGKWSYSAAGHVDEGEIYEQAAVRELKEELGIERNAADLTFIVKKRICDLQTQKPKHFHSIYTITYDGEIYPDASEISELRWFGKEELLDELHNNKEEYIYTFLDDVIPLL